jgi:hypothetical protein
MDLLRKIDEIIEKQDLHVHGGLDPHPKDIKHRGMLKYGNEMHEMHRDNIPHLHSEDYQIINEIKRKLALASNNKPFWKVYLKSICDKIDKKCLMAPKDDFYKETMPYFSSVYKNVRHFQRQTGFDIEEASSFLQEAKNALLKKNREAYFTSLRKLYNSLHIFLSKTFEEVDEEHE